MLKFNQYELYLIDTVLGKHAEAILNRIPEHPESEHAVLRQYAHDLVNVSIIAAKMRNCSEAIAYS